MALQAPAGSRSISQTLDSIRSEMSRREPRGASGEHQSLTSRGHRGSRSRRSGRGRQLATTLLRWFKETAFLFSNPLFAHWIGHKLISDFGPIKYMPGLLLIFSIISKVSINYSKVISPCPFSSDCLKVSSSCWGRAMTKYPKSSHMLDC